MNIKIHQPKGTTYNNKGSCRGLVNYLEHEDLDRMKEGEDKEFYFNRKDELIGSHEVINSIDKNKGQLGKEDAKFFCITISPSDKELASMGKNPEEQSKALKDYINYEVMQKYGENFKDRGLNADNIRYFAKIHYERDTRKEGNNMHCHIIVSRKDNENALKLSPLTNHKSTSKGAVKGGFERTDFYQKCETAFDQKFDYKRELSEKFEYCNTMKNGTIQAQDKMLEKSIQIENKNINQEKEIKHLQEQTKRQENKKENEINLSF